MKITLKLVGLLGLILFGSLFAVTYGVPGAVEESAKSFVKKKIEKEIRGKYQVGADSSLAEKARLIAKELGYEEQKIRDDINNKLPEKIAEVIASLCGYDCERKKVLSQSIKAGYMERIADLQFAQDRLGQIIKEKYIEIIGGLKTDLRIFLGSNFAMFGVLLIISLFKSRAAAHLFLPGVLLLVSTVIMTAVYLFGQDWFYTILYNDYMGCGYLVYLSAIFGFLMDVAFNKARITTEIINGFLNAIGSLFSVSPC